jgi:hypothetical protein
MPTTNYDVSELIRFRNARALYNFNKQLKVNNINKTCIPEQGAPATQEVFTQRTTGGMARIIDSKEKVASCCPSS